MSDSNPFDEIERAVQDDVARQLEMVQDLDGMDRDVTSWEASFLDSVLKQLRGGTPLTGGQFRILKAMHEQYGFS